MAGHCSSFSFCPTVTIGCSFGLHFTHEEIKVQRNVGITLHLHNQKRSRAGLIITFVLLSEAHLSEVTRSGRWHSGLVEIGPVSDGTGRRMPVVMSEYSGGIFSPGVRSVGEPGLVFLPLVCVLKICWTHISKSRCNGCCSPMASDWITKLAWHWGLAGQCSVMYKWEHAQIFGPGM